METQRRRTLVHVNLTHEKHRRHILMAPLPKRIQDGQIASTSPRPTPVVSEDLAIALGSKGSSASSVAIQSASVRNQNAEIVISIQLRNEMSDGNEELKTQGWLEWLRSAPSEAEAVEISAKEHSQFKDFVRQSHESHQEVNSLANARSDVDAQQTKHPESTHKSEVEVDSNEIPCKLSDLLETPFEFETSDFDLASGIGDIDSILGMTPRGFPSEPESKRYGPPQPLPSRTYKSLDLYQELLDDFSTRCSRINKWLENAALTSRMESLSLFSILEDQLAGEDHHLPSN